MATPIKDTPALKGKSAKKFLSKIKAAPKATPEEKARVKANYEAIKALSLDTKQQQMRAAVEDFYKRHGEAMTILAFE